MKLDRPYPADEQLALARQRLGPVSAALPAMVVVAALLRVLREVLTESAKLATLQPPFDSLLARIARLDDDVIRLFETPLLPGLEQYKAEHLSAYGDRYDLAARIPDALLAVVQLVMFCLELLRAEAKTKVTVGTPEEWAAIRADLTDLMALCAFGPLETKEGESVH